MASEIETLETKKQGDVVSPVETEAELPEAKEDQVADKEEDTKEGSSKRARAKKGETSSAKKARTGSGSPVTPIDRPTRERKTVERYTESAGRLPAPKPFSVEKGSGTQLKEIPNVAYKLSKRKPDDSLHALHTVLFNKRGKVNTLKKNIGMFSGFVWADDEGKQKTKVKERLDKLTKEKLFDFCDILNLQIHKSQLKKEEVSVKLLEFLQSPHATTEVLLAEQEQKGKKQKAKSKRSRTPSKKHSGEKRKRSSKTQEETNVDVNEGSENLDDSQEEDDDNTPSKPESVEEEDKSDDGGDDEELGEEGDEPEKASSKKSVRNSGKKTEGKFKAVKKDDLQEVEESEPEKTSMKSANKDSGNKTVEKSKAVKKADVKSPTKSNKKSSTPASKKGANASGSKVSSAKEEKSSSKMDTKGSAQKESAEDQGKEKTNKKEKAEPTNKEIYAVVFGILKEVDYNTATLGDIIKQLGTHFGQDLMHRKAEVKAIITDAGEKIAAEPTNKELHAVAVGILKEVDFNTATLSDIIKQLGTHFGLDLMHRKDEVKAIITEVINNMSGEEDEEEEEKEADGGSGADKDDGDKNDS
uniref:protein DEK-like isoform X2 n=1 Tax=Erigeron canadensis TaxID=72917 RepID=UPI001CB96679|nr:protein DEK-like isoform X2 [Erigeron canadensis]